VFWTIPVPDASVNVDLDDATASIDVRNQAVADYHTILNALMGGPSIPSTVSFHIRWFGVQERVRVRDPKNRFVADYIDDKATIAWSASRKGFTFVSDPAHTSTSVFAGIGSERNGVFFS